MTNLMYIVKLAKRGGNWVTLDEVKEWKYVSAITIEDGEITEFEFSPERKDAKEFSRFTAQDIAKAMPERFYGIPEKVAVHLGQTDIPVAAAPVNFTVYPDGIAKNFRIKAPKGCESAHFCKVTWNRRSLILQQTAVSDKTIKGMTLDGIPTIIFLRKGVKVEPLAASCEGTLVPVKLSCHCNNGAALAVEHGKGWAA